VKLAISNNCQIKINPIFQLDFANSDLNSVNYVKKFANLLKWFQYFSQFSEEGMHLVIALSVKLRAQKTNVYGMESGNCVVHRLKGRGEADPRAHLSFFFSLSLGAVRFSRIVNPASVNHADCNNSHTALAIRVCVSPLVPSKPLCALNSKLAIAEIKWKLVEKYVCR